MIGVKFFEESNLKNLEENINVFLTEPYTKKVIDIKYQQLNNNYYSALVIFEY